MGRAWREEVDWGAEWVVRVVREIVRGGGAVVGMGEGEGEVVGGGTEELV